MKKIIRALILSALTVLLVACVFMLSSCGEKYLSLTVENTIDGSTYFYGSQYFEDEKDYKKGESFPYDCSFPGFEFGGIYSKPNGEGKMFIDSDCVITRDLDFGEDIYLYYYYIPIEYTLTLIDSQSGQDETIATIQYNYFTDGYTLPTVTCNKENYEFVGWGADELLEIKRGTIGDKTMHPVFKGKHQSIKFDAGEGFLTQSEMEVRYDDWILLPEPTPIGNDVFLGWVYTGTENYVYGDVVDKDEEGHVTARYVKCEGPLSFTAKYSKTHEITVSFMLGGALDCTRIYKYVESRGLKLDVPAFTGYRAGALTDASGNSVSYSGGVVNMPNITEDSFYVWNYDKLVSSVTLDGAGNYIASNSPSYSLTYGDSFELPLAYKIGGYAFSGWKVLDTDKLVTDGNGKSVGTWDVDLDEVTLVPEFSASANAASPVYDKQSFLAIQNNPAGTYVLFTDVNLTDTPWVPVNFSGKLDGNGHTVSGISLFSQTGALGIFLSLTGSVSNVTFRDITVVSESNAKVNVGGLCASLSGSVTGVEIYGSVVADYANVGGIAGAMTAGIVKNSKSYVTVSTGTYEASATAGGIVGSMTNGKITECENGGNVAGYANVGGIVGAAANVNTVTNVKNTVSVTGRSSYVGGIVGKMTASNVADSAVTFNNLNNAGMVDGASNVGGCIGYVECWGNWWENRTYLIDIYKLTNSAGVSGDNNVGGCIGYVTASTGKAAFSPRIEVKMTDLVNTGNIDAASVAGGCIGYAASDFGNSKIIRSSSSATVTAEHTAGGIAGITSGVRIVSCTNTGSKLIATGYYVSNSSYYVRLGGIAGQASYIEDCRNESKIEYSNKGGYVGGIVGYATGTLTGLINSGEIYAPTSDHVGGIAGCVALGGAGSMSELENSGKVTAAHNVGGIFGTITSYITENSNNVHTLTLTRLENSGDIITTGSFVGGVIGKLEVEGYRKATWDCKVKVVVTYANNSGNVTAESTLCIGGVFGYVSTDTNESMGDAVECTGKLNGAEVSADKLAGSVTDFRIA